MSEKIDVSKCKLNHENNEMICMMKCEEMDDCYYKQLQQLKQENEVLHHTIHEWQHDCNSKREKLEKIREFAMTLGNQSDVKHKLNDKDVKQLLNIDNNLLSNEDILRKYILQIIEE